MLMTMPVTFLVATAPMAVTVPSMMAKALLINMEMMRAIV